MATEKKSWVKDLLVAFAATTLSIILTFGTTALVDHHRQKKERKLTALMVMSSIEQFARLLDDLEKDLSHPDSVATWLLSLPLEDVAKLGDKPLAMAFEEIYAIPTLSHDHTAEAIFSSNIDTWKTMGNFRFIDNVGACFSAMNGMEEQLNEELVKYHAAKNVIFEHPSDYPGGTMAEKYLQNEPFRQQLLLPNASRRWLTYCAEALRESNRQNMHLIGIPEKEVMEFTDKLGAGEEYEGKMVDLFDFERPYIDIDSLKVQLPIARQADSLLRVKNGIGQ